jgi:hypothetical protein
MYKVKESVIAALAGGLGPIMAVPIIINSYTISIESIYKVLIAAVLAGIFSYLIAKILLYIWK